MEKTNKKRNRNQTDFLRYLKGDMSGEERNSFERELQKDPFAEEASEGFSQITAEEAENDLSHLEKQIEIKTRKRSYGLYYRIAASVAVFVTLSILYFNDPDKKEDRTLSKNDIEEVKVPITIAATEPLTDKTEKSEPADKSESPTLPLTPSPPRAARAEAEEKEVVAEDDAKPSEEEKKMEDALVAGVALKKEAQVPLSARSKSVSAVLPPEPVTGLDSFNIWIEKNIHNPEPDNNIQEAVVISFRVMIDSTIANIKIVNSPGDAYSREALRLIKEGPSWKPGMIDGKQVEVEYLITIRFR